MDYNVRATSIGQDALGEVSVKVHFGDCDDCNAKPISGKGAATDVIEASARAYLNAVNRNITFAQLGIWYRCYEAYPHHCGAGKPRQRLRCYPSQRRVYGAG